jgi:hypothetical protein
MSNEYKFSAFDKTQIKAAARKALITADSLYYSWPPEKKEYFRATKDEQLCQKVERVLLDSLLNIQCSLEEVDEVWSNVPLINLNVLNWANLLTKGIGEDTLCLSEYLADDKT